MTYKRKRHHKEDNRRRTKWRTRHRRKDLDEVNEDLKPENVSKLIYQEFDENKPGGAQFYCIHCTRYFIDDQALQEHFRSKGHKRRLKDLETEPYTIEESERAAGKGNYIKPKKRKIETVTKDMDVESSCYSSPVLKTEKLRSTDRLHSPFVDIAEKLEDMSKLQRNVELRKLDLDPVKFKSLWELFKHLKATKVQLEQRKNQIANNINNIKKIGKDSEAAEELTKLKTELGMVREDYKTLTTAYWDVEEKVSLQSLLIPNELHRDTPSEEDKVIHEFGEIPQLSHPVSHLVTGADLDIIDYRDPSRFYLKNEGALFEVSCAYYIVDTLKKNDFVPFCNPDFAREVIVDACGKDSSGPELFAIQPDKTNKEDRNHNYKLHLVGGSSIYPFCAFHTNQTVSFSSLPIKYFTLGRQYSPSSNDSKFGLYNTWQKTTSEIFILTSDDDNEMMSAFQQTLEKLISLYENLNYHFRVVYLKACSLENWESLRASFQMYSCHQQKYVEVGKISVSGNYISQKLLMTYQMSDNDNNTRIMNVISGTVVDITKLLACILEQRNSCEKFSIPDCLKSHWSV